MTNKLVCSVMSCRGLFFLPLGLLFLAMGASASAQSLAASRSPPLNSTFGLANSCAHYGQGYVMVAGSSTCLKISGHIRVETQGQNAASSIDASGQGTGDRTAVFGRVKPGNGFGK